MYSVFTIRRVLRSSKSRQFHTLLSKEFVKPASATPNHLKYYNLSLLDQFATAAYAPLVFFYPNHGSETASKIVDSKLLLKKTLSESLARYYPFAGRFTDGAFLHCNDEGVELLEVRFKGGLSEILEDSDYRALAPLCPVSLAGENKYNGTSPLMVQLNYFDCGGLAVTVCMSHKIADGSSLFTFLNYWANQAREHSGRRDRVPLHFIGTPTAALPSDDSISVPDINFQGEGCVTKSYVFSNSKLAQLKGVAVESGIDDPTRVQVLTSLLYERAMAANLATSGSFRPSALIQPVNLRPHTIPKLPVTSFGNFCLGNTLSTIREEDANLNNVAVQLKKGIMQFKGLKVPNVSEWLSFMREPMLDGLKQLYGPNRNLMIYYCSSFSRYPSYSLDFGWGKPVKVTFAGCLPKNTMILLDTPNEDGIAALITLEEEDMAAFQQDKKLLDFAS